MQTNVLRRGSLTRKSFLAALLQALIILMLLAALAGMVLTVQVLALVEVLLSVTYIAIVAVWLREETANEFGKYALFFLGVWLAVQAVWVVQFLFSPAEAYVAVIGIVVALFVFIAAFALVFGRRYTFGKVLLCDDGLAAVETDFDLLSFTRAGRFVVKGKKGLKKGDSVKVGIGRTFFGRKPAKII